MSPSVGETAFFGNPTNNMADVGSEELACAASFAWLTVPRRLVPHVPIDIVIENPTLTTVANTEGATRSFSIFPVFINRENGHFVFVKPTTADLRLYPSFVTASGGNINIMQRHWLMYGMAGSDISKDYDLAGFAFGIVGFVSGSCAGLPFQSRTNSKLYGSLFRSGTATLRSLRVHVTGMPGLWPGYLDYLREFLISTGLPEQYDGLNRWLPPLEQRICSVVEKDA